MNGLNIYIHEKLYYLIVIYSWWGREVRWFICLLYGGLDGG